MKARKIFKDCEYAKERLRQAIEQENLEDAKLFWFSALAMLRAIGHVLHKVDAENLGVNFRNALEERYKLWKQDPIFINFIERERNVILKEYESSLAEQTTSEVFFLLTESGDRLVTKSGDALLGTKSITTLMKEQGAYSGNSPIFALDKALAWWDKELTELEKIS